MNAMYSPGSKSHHGSIVVSSSQHEILPIYSIGNKWKQLSLGSRIHPIKSLTFEIL